MINIFNNFKKWKLNNRKKWRIHVTKFANTIIPQATTFYNFYYYINT